MIWSVVPTAPVVDGNAQLEFRVGLTRQTDTLLKYFLTVVNLTGAPLSFEARFEVLGWSRDFR